MIFIDLLSLVRNYWNNTYIYLKIFQKLNQMNDSTEKEDEVHPRRLEFKHCLVERLQKYEQILSCNHTRIY